MKEKKNGHTLGKKILLTVNVLGEKIKLKISSQIPPPGSLMVRQLNFPSICTL